MWYFDKIRFRYDCGLIRSERGLTFRQFGDACAISERAGSLAIKEGRVGLPVLLKICSAFGLNPADYIVRNIK